jgi:hypothetical protein
MASTNSDGSSPALTPEAAEDMKKYGIVRVPVDYYYFGKFRYTNLDDALAQAKHLKAAD